MTEIDFESAQLELLTEALRAGPGTPQWREALTSIEIVPGADEYKLLCTARERLASGRAYREVRAGAAFTRQVFDTIDRDEAAGTTARPRSLMSANIIAAVSAAAILGILAVVAFWIVPRNEQPPGTEDQLSQTYFVNTLASSSFEEELGSEFSIFGPLTVETHSGLRPAAAVLDSSTFSGGGVIYQRSFEVDQPFAIEATVALSKPSDDLVVQLFVADDRNLSGPSATSPHELVWSLRGGEPSSVVLPDGIVAASGPRWRGGQPTITARLSINRSDARVDANGRRIWSGTSQFDASKPRVAGVRFLARGKVTAKDAAVVQSVRVLVPQK